MSQYAQSGSAMDDAQASDGDGGFVSVNQRLQLNQLEAGEVRESLNGRMEGYWKPRKGVVAVTGPLTSGGSPLQLPFFLIGTSVAITAASVTSGVVTLTTSSAHGLTNGSAFSTSGIIYTTGTNPNNSFIATTASGTSITYPLVGGSGTYTTDATSEVLTATSKAIASSSLSANEVTIVVTAGHGLAASSVAYALISGLGFTGTDPNGVRLLTYVSSTQMKFSVTAATTAVSGSGTLSQIPINDAANVNVRASCLFSDPNSGNAESVVLALDTKAILVDLDGYAISDLDYPTNQTVSEDTDMIQAFDRVFLFRDGKQAFEWFPNGRQIESASQSGTFVVTMRIKDHGLTANDEIIVSGLTGGTPANGTFTVLSVTDKDVFTYTFTTSQTQTFVVTAGVLKAGFTLVPGGAYTQPQIFTTTGNDLSVNNGLLSITVTGNTTIAAGDTVVVYETTVPEFSAISGKSFEVLSATTTNISFIAPLGNYTQDIVSASQIATTVTAVVKGHGFVVGNSITVAGLTGVNGGTMPNGTQTVVSVSGDTFTYTAAAALTYYTIGTPLNATATSWGVGGVITITINAHGFAGNGYANISGFTGGDTILNGNHLFTRVNANQLSFVVATSTSVTYQTPILSQMTYDLVTTGATARNPTRDGQQIEFGGQFSVGGGFIHQPAPPWGVYFQRRLWVPFYYTPAGPFSAPTYTSRKITDEISVSDILDSHTFDQIANQFRITGGTTDYLVAMQGFYDDKLVVLNRNSLHLISGTTGSLEDTKVTALTNEVGCLAKKSVVMKGNAMFFLSDDGIYAVEFLNDYNLRGADEPISKNIQPYIDRINKNLAKEAVGILFDNRYYIAVALDSIAGANDASGNNTILVFNFLNKGWESIDTFGAGDFIIKNLITGSAAERNSIYAVTSLGGLHELEATETSNDSLLSAGIVTSFSINSSLTTRGYSFGNLDRKRFTDGQITMQCVNAGLGEYSISFAAEDPDNNQSIGTTTTFLDGVVLGTGAVNEDETGNIRFRLGGIRGYVGSLTLTRTIGSPKITSLKVTGSVTNRQIISQT